MRLSEDQIREALTDRNLTVVAHRLQMSTFTLYRFVNRDYPPTERTLEMLDEYLRCPDWMLAKNT